MLVLTSVVLFTGVLTMWELEKRVKEYFALTFLLVAGVYGVFMSMDLFFIFVWYDVSLFPMYPLIAIWGGTRKEYGAMKLTLYLLAGSALILPGILYLWVLGGAGTFDLFELQRIGFTVEAQRIAFVLLYLGFGILAGVWPFHTWSPVGHVAAPTAVSMIHAGVLMKLGAYGILRVGMTLCPEGLVYWADLMALLATIGIVYGAFVGLAQTDLKYVIGYSSVSHMGIVGLGLATMTVDGINGAVFQMFSHGIMTALLFSAVGYIYDRTHTKMIPELGGLSKTMPVASAFFIIAAFCGIGVPCLASFWAELLVFISAVKTYPVRGVFAVMGLVVSALFMLRVVQKTFYGEKNKRWEHIPDVPLFLASPRIILVGILVFFGLFPRLILDVIQSAVVPFVNSL
jgi:NADH-quinone oxidoreductase subunit M